MRKLASLAIESGTRGWLLFNVTRAVSHWQQRPQENLGLLVRVHCDHMGQSHALLSCS